MLSRPAAVVLLVLGAVTASGIGAYLAVRQNAADRVAGPAPTQPAAVTAIPSDALDGTEAVVEPPAGATGAVEPAPQPVRPALPVTPDNRRTSADSRRSQPAPAPPAAPRTDDRRAPPAPTLDRPWPTREPAPQPPPVAVKSGLPPDVGLPVDQYYPPPEPVFEELVISADSVVGLQIERSISSETARLEDAVEARVTRDVMVAGRVAVPAGTRAIGSVTLVDRGGKVKERARLGVRFHMLVLADMTRVPIQTESIFREGDPPSGDSVKKIGGGAITGAVIGAIFGGAKGAAIGGAAGAGAGTAATMAGDRNAATLPVGATVTVRLNNPVTIVVER